MKNTKKISIALFVSTFIGFLLSTSVFAEPTGNRYNLPRDYQSEVSSAEAYLLTNAKHEYRDEDDKDIYSKHRSRGDKYDNRKVVLIDVRTIEEYVDGHPRKSYSIPYPHIQRAGAYIGQNPKDFFDYVAEQFPDRDTPILTLCRSGFRSVLAANILANPSAWVPEYEGLAIEGYSNVRNIWEGFRGNYKTRTDPETGISENLDLNNNGEMDDGDRDGWAYYQGLPYSLKLRSPLLYEPNIDLYFQ